MKTAIEMFLAFAMLVLGKNVLFLVLATPLAWSLVDVGLLAVAAGVILFRNNRADPNWA